MLTAASVTPASRSAGTWDRRRGSSPTTQAGPAAVLAGSGYANSASSPPSAFPVGPHSVIISLPATYAPFWNPQVAGRGLAANRG